MSTLALVTAAAAVLILATAALALIVMILGDTIAAWPPPPRHRRQDTPGRQLWTRSEPADTVPMRVPAAFVADADFAALARGTQT